MINDVATRMIDRRIKELEACVEMVQKIPEHAISPIKEDQIPSRISGDLTPVIGTTMQKGMLENATRRSMGALPT